MGFLCCLGLSLNTSSLGALLLSLLKFIGFLKMLELIYRLVWTFRRNQRTTAHLTERYGRGSWAVITGGSDGIGLAMAKELARRQFNIVIVGRSQAKMEEAARDIKAVRAEAQVRLVEFDFTKTANSHSVEDYQKGIVDKINDLDISLLVNNAGYLVPGDFERVPIEEHKNMLAVGIMTATMLTKLLTDKMITRATGGA